MRRTIATIVVSLVSLAISGFSYIVARTLGQQSLAFAQPLDPQPHQHTLPFVSVIVPARNEAAYIEACVRAILDQDYPNMELLVVDDGSTDETGRILAALRINYPHRFRILTPPSPSDDWLGKNNAVWFGYTHIQPQTEWLLFVDADTCLQPGALQHCVGYVRQHDLHMLSLLPSAVLPDFWTKLLTAQLAKLYALLSRAQPTSNSTAVDAAVAAGPFILARRDAYAATDGHRAVRNQIVEDVLLAKRFRQYGYSTALFSAPTLVTMTPYAGLGDLWESTTKNLFLVGTQRWSQVWFVVGLESVYSFLPCGFLAFRLLRRSSGRIATLLNLVAVGAIIAAQHNLNRTLRIPFWYALLYPIAAVMGCALLIDSAIRTRLGRTLTWKGRTLRAEGQTILTALTRDTP